MVWRLIVATYFDLVFLGLDLLLDCSANFFTCDKSNMLRRGVKGASTFYRDVKQKNGFLMSKVISPQSIDDKKVFFLLKQVVLDLLRYILSLAPTVRSIYY